MPGNCCDRFAKNCAEIAACINIKIGPAIQITKPLAGRNHIIILTPMIPGASKAADQTKADEKLAIWNCR